MLAAGSFGGHARPWRFVCSARSECLDWLVIVNRRHRRVSRLRRAYNGHGRCKLTPPHPRRATLRLVTPPTLGRVHRRDRLGGLINEDQLAASEPHLRTLHARGADERGDESAGISRERSRRVHPSARDGDGCRRVGAWRVDRRDRPSSAPSLLTRTRHAALRAAPLLGARRMASEVSARDLGLDGFTMPAMCPPLLSTTRTSPPRRPVDLEDDIHGTMCGRARPRRRRVGHPEVLKIGVRIAPTGRLRRRRGSPWPGRV